MSTEIVIPSTFAEVLGEVDGGVMERIVSKAMCDMAASIMDQKRDGKIVLTMSMSHIKNTTQLNIKTSVKTQMPTMDEGERTEMVKRDTAMFVGKFGKLSVAPESQLDLPGIVKRGNAAASGS